MTKERFFLYFSLYGGRRSDIQVCLSDIGKKSSTYNKINDITGVLIFHRGIFVQALEGPAKNIEALASKIMKDERHENIRLLEDKDVSCRCFEQWHLEIINTEATTLAHEIPELTYTLKAIIPQHKRILVPFFKDYIAAHKLDLPSV